MKKYLSKALKVLNAISQVKIHLDAGFYEKWDSALSLGIWTRHKDVLEIFYFELFGLVLTLHLDSIGE